MSDHRDRTITIQLTGKFSDDLRLDDFLEQMQTLRTALRETERFVTGREPSLYFRIKALSKQSPARVVLEAVSDSVDERSGPLYASYVVRSLTTNLRVISKRHRLPAKIDVPVLESYREMTAPAEKRQLEVTIQAGKHSVLINSGFRQTLEKIVGDDEFSYGSISGKIEAINLHDRNRRFQIFPTVGASRVVGTFRSKQRDRFVSAVDKYVTVFGRLRYKTWDRYPYAITADDIEVHDVAATTLDDLKGIAPHATGNLTTQEFVDRLNDEW